MSSCIFAVDAPTDAARDTGSGPVDAGEAGSLDAGTTGRVTKSDGAWVSENDTACSTQGIRLYCIDGQ